MGGPEALGRHLILFSSNVFTSATKIYFANNFSNTISGSLFANASVSRRAGPITSNCITSYYFAKTCVNISDSPNAVARVPGQFRWPSGSTSYHFAARVLGRDRWLISVCTASYALAKVFNTSSGSVCAIVGGSGCA